MYCCGYCQSEAAMAAFLQIASLFSILSSLRGMSKRKILESILFWKKNEKTFKFNKASKCEKTILCFH